MNLHALIFRWVGIALPPLLGVVVLCGWLFQIEFLKRINPSLVAMNPLTALHFILLGLSLWAVISPDPRWVRMGKLGASIVLFASVVKFGNFFGLWSMAPDQFLFSNQVNNDILGQPNRMAPNTAFNFLLLASGILVITSGKRLFQQMGQFAICLVFFVSMLALVGYIYGEISFFQVQAYIPMAIHTAFSFMVLSLGAFFSQRENRLLSLFLGNNSAGTMVRFLFPLAIIIPTAFGGLCLVGTREGFFDFQFGGALFAVGCILTFSCLIVYSAKRLGIIDQQRDLAEKKLVEANADLEKRVKERTEALAQSMAEEHKLELQLQRSQRLESVGALAGGIAHDLNNAFSPIGLGLEMLKSKLTTPKEKRLLETLTQCTRRGGEMVRQILAFARGKENSGQLQVWLLVLEIQKMAQNTFSKSIEIKCDCLEEPWEIRGDTTQIYQVLMNLCVNARDAMPKGGVLQIHAENMSVPGHEATLGFSEVPPGKYVLISVSDNGTGIAPAIRDEIFEPFFTTKKSNEGTGLGLAMVKTIVKNHQAYITLKSVEGMGTTFYLLFPALETIPPAADGMEMDAINGSSELILVVDDEEAVQEMNKTILEMYDYRVITAKHGAEAIVLFQSSTERIGLVIMDTNMPLMDGPTTITALRKLDPSLTVLVASGEAQPSNLPSVRYLPKPYSMRDLLKAVADCMGDRAPEARETREKAVLYTSA